jgi:hypothetical protein
MIKIAVVIIFASGVLSLVSCGSSANSSGATCPKGTALSYTNFGKGFVDAYCLRCHGSFSSIAEVRRQAAAIDQHAAAGPNVTNTAMPKSAPIPSNEDRKKLGEWLACGAP